MDVAPPQSHSGCMPDLQENIADVWHVCMKVNGMDLRKIARAYFFSRRYDFEAVVHANVSEMSIHECAC